MNEAAAPKAISNEIEPDAALKERVRDLEKQLREVRETAEEALRIAKRAKRGLVAYH